MSEYLEPILEWDRFVRIPDNPNWPLPPDYEEIVGKDEGVARVYRVNAACQWLDPKLTQAERGVAFDTCLEWFDRTYLWPKKGYDPGFYDLDPAGTCPAMRNVRAWSMQHQKSAFVLWRGAGKSFEIDRQKLFMLLCCKYYSASHVTSRDSLAKKRGRAILSQLRRNKWILGDFTPEFQRLTGFDHIAPKRYSGVPATAQLLQLHNGSFIEHLSASGGLRGNRPLQVYFDDVERDPDASTNTAELRKDTEHLVFRVISPMMTSHVARFTIFGTFPHPSSMLTRMFQDIVDEAGNHVPADPRYEKWHRVKVPVMLKKKDGTVSSSWPEVFPVDRADARARGLPEGLETLEDRRESMGPAGFEMEMQGELTDAENYFEVDQSHKSMCSVWLEGVDEYWADEPHKSQTKICWDTYKKGEVVRENRVPAKEFLEEHRLFIIGDTSAGSGPTSDRKAWHVGCMTRDKEYMSLDLWSGNTSEPRACEEGFRLAQKWRVKLMLPEFTTHQAGFYATLKSMAADNVMSMEHVPSVVPLKIGHRSKTDKISALKLFFDTGRVKLPFFRRKDQAYLRMFDQVFGFNPEADNGGLTNDDEIDTLALFLFATKLRAVNVDRDEAPGSQTAEGLLLAGKNVSDWGVPLAMMPGFAEACEAHPEEANAMMAGTTKKENKRATNA